MEHSKRLCPGRGSLGCGSALAGLDRSGQLAGRRGTQPPRTGAQDRGAQEAGQGRTGARAGQGPAIVDTTRTGESSGDGARNWSYEGRGISRKVSASSRPPAVAVRSTPATKARSARKGTTTPATASPKTGPSRPPAAPARSFAMTRPMRPQVLISRSSAASAAKSRGPPVRSATRLPSTPALPARTQRAGRRRPTG